MAEHPRQKAPGPEQASEGRGDPLGPSTHLFRTVWGDVRQGAEHFKRWSVPPPDRPVRQFFHGLSLPFHLMRALWADAEARRRYLRVGILQSVTILALAITCHGSGNRAADSARERDARASSADITTPEAQERQERERFKLEIKLAAEELKDKIIAQIGDPKQDVPGEQLQSGEDAKAADEAKEEDPKGLEDGLELALERTKKLAETDEFQFWVALFAAMQIAQWVVIALSHDYHDVIERDASLLTALEPEEGPITPRIRVDGKWLRKRVRRRIRGLTLFLTGMPVIYGFTAPFPFSKTLIAVLIPLWSAYWVVMFTAAKSAHAWKNSNAGEPWFLRAWNWLTTRVPGFRWRFLQRYGLFWANRTREVFPPASELEKQPWAFSGLAATRMLSMIPLVSCFLRPLIPVAAAHLLVAKRAAETTEPSKSSGPSAKPPDTSSASAA